MEATVKEMLIGNKPATCGLITHATKLTFRTRSANVFWLVQACVWGGGVMCVCACVVCGVCDKRDSFYVLGGTGVRVVYVIYVIRVLYVLYVIQCSGWYR